MQYSKDRNSNTVITYNAMHVYYSVYLQNIFFFNTIYDKSILITAIVFLRVINISMCMGYIHYNFYRSIIDTFLYGVILILRLSIQCLKLQFVSLSYCVITSYSFTYAMFYSQNCLLVFYTCILL